MKYFLPIILISTILWSTATIVDRNLVYNKFDDQIFVLCCCFFFASIIILPTSLLLIDVSLPKTWEIFMLLALIAIFYALSYYSYFKALQLLEASTVAILYKITTILVIFAGIIIFKETYSLSSYLGLFLIVIASILAAMNEELKLSSPKGVVLMILSCLFLTSLVVLQKGLLDFADLSPFNIFFWQYFFTLLIVLTFGFAKYGTEIITAPMEQDRAIPLFIISQSSNEFGELAWITAISIGPLSLASAITSLTTLLVFIFAIIIHILFGNSHLGRNTSRKVLVFRTASIILIIIGFSFIYLI